MRRATIRPARRALHLIGDLILIGWALLWIGVAGIVHAVVMAVASPALALNESTSSLAGKVEDAAESLGNVRVVGDQLAAPFQPIATSLRDMAGQGGETVTAIEQAAFAIAVVVFLVPTCTLAIMYVPLRIRRARESAAARSYINDQADLDLFALRAMAKTPMTRIAAITGDPVGAWRRGDATIILELANLELRRVGIGVADIIGEPAGRSR